MEIHRKVHHHQKNVFSLVVEEATKRGIIGTKIKESVEWYRNFIRKRVYRVNVFDHLPNNRIKNKPAIGKMYLFGYDAETKDKLPYWDAFPCTLFFNEDAQHVYGFNLHYVPPEIRAKILDFLWGLMGDSALTENQRLRRTYNGLKRFSEFAYLKPCIKCYLKSNFTTQLIEVPSNEWQIAVFLGVAKWQKASASMVYKDSRKIGKF